MSFLKTQYLDTPQGRLAYRYSGGNTNKTTLVWCGGLRSDMLGGKATELHLAAMQDDRPYLRFDYTGHGESDVPFEKTTIADWRRDTLTVLDELTCGDLILVGSSMGGWTSLLAALARPERVKGLVLVAPAPDFTEKLMWAEFDEDVRNEINTKGFWMRPSPYEDDYPITKALIDAGRELQIMEAPIDLKGIPVRILQGMRDDAVPWQYAQSLVEKLTSNDVEFKLIKDGDHRLSRPKDIAMLIETVLGLALQLESPVEESV